MELGLVLIDLERVVLTQLAVLVVHRALSEVPKRRLLVWFLAVPQDVELLTEFRDDVSGRAAIR